MKTEEAVKTIVERLKKNPPSCIVCQGQPYCLGVFLPDNDVEFGGKEGKQRVIGYSLCRRHESWRNIPHKMTEIEDILKKNLRVD